MRLGHLVARTPSGRDRVVDAVRAGAIVVVVLWHWVGSLTHRGADGVVVMPNPIADVPGGWLATWVLQVVPVFFVVGGYANLAGWDSVRGRGGGRGAAFLRRRARRLLAPVAVWVALWLTVELVSGVVVEGHRPLWEWFPGVLVPLWFLLVYAAVTALVPWTARWHRATGGWALAAMGVALVVSELLARVGGVDAAVWVSSALVWVLVHQLGYLWRDHGADPRRGVVLVVAGLAGLAALTGVAGYPRSMVATEGVESNMLPTTAAVVALAVLQLGLVWVLAGPLARLLAARWAWRPVVALNVVALTVFVWHMSAYAAVFLLAERVGIVADARPSAEWLLSRPGWFAASALVLVVAVMVFGRIEHGPREPGPPTPVDHVTAPGNQKS